MIHSTAFCCFVCNLAILRVFDPKADTLSWYGIKSQWCPTKGYRCAWGIYPLSLWEPLPRLALSDYPTVQQSYFLFPVFHNVKGVGKHCLWTCFDLCLLWNIVCQRFRSPLMCLSILTQLLIEYSDTILGGSKDPEKFWDIHQDQSYLRFSQIDSEI